MKIAKIGLFFIIVGLCMMRVVSAGEKPHWGYVGLEGPEYWGEIDPAYSLCSKGKNQSPINLRRMVESDLLPMTVNYRSFGTEILNNGHTIQVKVQPGSTIEVDGHEFELNQFHFHSPSENTIDGHSYPMEGHFVHADKEGNLAVISVLFKTGEKNVELQKAWAHMPEKSGETRTLPTSIDPKVLLPHNLDYYRFNGSLTTPPCTEGVWWFVMKHFQAASEEQIETFARTIDHPNNRPVQPIGARVILK